MLGEIGGVRIAALTATVSKNRVPVQERCAGLITLKKAQRMMAGVGIEKISIAPEGVCTSDLCFAAASRLFEQGGFDKADIGAILFLSQTADYLTPATSYYLQSRLGLPEDCLAFDINLGCSGFVYGIYVAATMLSNINRKILLCCGDTSSDNAYPGDLSMLSIAGDAGAAAIISRTGAEEALCYNINSFGDRANLLLVKRGGARAPILTDTKGKRLPIRENYCAMDGMGVMDFSLHEVPENIQALFDYGNVSADSIEMAYVHQANRLIVESLADTLGIARDRMPFASNEIGNTSSASIPVCIAEMKRRAAYHPCSKALISGFGVGLSVASMLVSLKDTVVLGTGEV